MTTAVSAAIAAADAGANDKWKEAALDIVEDLATFNDTFTTDEVWDELKTRGLHTPEHRAMGPVMVRAARLGICEPETCNSCGTTKVMTKTARPEAHRMDITVYRSLIR